MRVGLIVVWFGKWPLWFPAFLQSCKFNPDIDWLLFTDCPAPPASSVENVKFIPFSTEQFNSLASDKLNHPINIKRPYKVCDFRPAYGVIFKDFLNEYDFWGYCDIDVIWGDISRFVTSEMLSKYSIITSKKDKIAGHFSLFRNTQEVNSIFKSYPGYIDVLTDEKNRWFDETLLTKHLHENVLGGADNDIEIYWEGLKFADWGQLERYTRGWKWENGKILDSRGKESLYAHFMTWKKLMKDIDFQYENPPNKFIITPLGIWSQRPLLVERITLVLIFLTRRPWRKIVMLLTGRDPAMS